MKKSLLLIALVSLFAAQAFAGAHIVVNNLDPAGTGFNDPTAAAPIGGNPGTTKGQQALNVFQQAATIWGANLDSSVTINIDATFEPLACTATGSVLGSAGAQDIWSDFPNAEFAGTWYHSALASKRAGTDLAALDGLHDIRARFNNLLATPNPACGNLTWYFGYDGAEGTNQIDLLAVVLHEFGHGLGFSTFVNKSTGAELAGLHDIYEHYLADDSTSTPTSFLDMTNAQRSAAIIKPLHVVWTGPKVDAAVTQTLAFGTPGVIINSPASIAGNYLVGSAAFGPPIGSPTVTGQLVLSHDPTAATNGCNVIDVDMTGKIGVADRGTCTFAVKAKNMQNAGAIGAIIVNNAAGSPPPGLGGADPTITIPVGSLTLADGTAIKAQIPGGVNATLGVDSSLRAGSDRAGHALLYAPNPVVGGSSTSHWDPIAFPNQLMEPAINGDLTHNVTPPYDMTMPLFREIGWYPDADLDLVADDNGDACLGSDLQASVIIGGNNSGVPNTLFTNGCTIKDLVNQCSVSAKNHGAFSGCVAGLGNALLSNGVITSAQKDALQSAAARAK
jgi:hypothetical protein